MTDKQIKEINEQIKKDIQKVENISKKYDELREKYKAKEQECEELKEAIKTKTGKDYINEIQDITMKYECHQKSMGVCWWGKYGKETKCIGIRECHKRELEVIQKLETTLDQLKEKNEEWQKEYWKLEQENDFLAEKNSILKGRLAEIKEIAEDFCGDCKENSDLHKLGDCKHRTYSMILNKISEVEDEHK